MRRLLVLFGIVGGLAPATALAQAVPEGSRDGTNNVRSSTMGTPGQTTNAVDQYLQRQGLQDLGSGPGGKKGSDKVEAARPAKADELSAGATVNDKTGIAMAKVESVDPDGVVVSMGTAKVKVPTEAFGHNKSG